MIIQTFMVMTCIESKRLIPIKKFERDFHSFYAGCRWKQNAQYTRHLSCDCERLNLCNQKAINLGANQTHFQYGRVSVLIQNSKKGYKQVVNRFVRFGRLHTSQSSSAFD